MKTVLLYAFAAAAMTLGAHPALAQPANGCPAGQAMQSSDPSGHKITCVPVGGGEADIIGQWAMTGTTNCLQSSAGFNPQTFSPVIPTAGATSVTPLAGTFIGTRTFYAGGTVRQVGTSHSLSLPATNYGAGVAPMPGKRYRRREHGRSGRKLHLEHPGGRQAGDRRRKFVYPAFHLAAFVTRANGDY